MIETDYDRTEMLARRLRDIFLYDLKSSIQLVATGAHLMQAIFETMDDTCMQDDDVATLRQISIILMDASDRMSDSTGTLREEVDIILKKHKGY